jgi:hypothetical protein
MHHRREWSAGFRRGLLDRWGYTGWRFDRDAIERKVGIEDAHQWCRFIDTDLGAGEWMRGRKAIVSIPVGRVPWGIVVDE